MVKLEEIAKLDGQITAEDTSLQQVQGTISQREAYVGGREAEVAGHIERLAAMYVPGFTQAAVQEVPNTLRSGVQELYDQRMARIRQLDESLVVASRHVAELRAQETEAGQALYRAQDLEDQTQAAYDASLSSSTEYDGLQAALEGVQDRCAALDTELARRQARRDEFQAPYLADPVFTYFLKREASLKGAPASLMQKLDGYFSRMYGFAQRRMKFDLFDAELTEVQEEIAASSALLNQAQAPVAAIEQRVAAEVGLTAAKEQVGMRQGSYERVTGALERAEADEARYSGERKSLVAEKGSHYERAVEGVVKRLSSMSIEGLLALAKSTPAPEDDGIARTIDGLYDDIRSARAQIAELREEESGIEGRIKGLKADRSALKKTYDEEQAEIARKKREKERQEKAAAAARRSSSPSYGSSFNIGSGRGGSSSIGGSFRGGGGSRVGGSF